MEKDIINHPSHYAKTHNGCEPIDLAERFPFTIGNAIKYLIRAGNKENTPTIDDLKKARWYLFRVLKTHTLPVMEIGNLASKPDSFVETDVVANSFSSINGYIAVLFAGWGTSFSIDTEQIGKCIELIDIEIDRINKA